MQLGGRADFLRPFIWSHVSGLTRFRNGSDKETASMHQILCHDATSLSRVITGDKGWIYGYEPAKQERKSPNSPRPKKVRQENSKVNSMLIIFSDIKGIVHKEFIVAGQTVSSAYYCDILR
jgi:hypothetical protein